MNIFKTSVLTAFAIALISISGVSGPAYALNIEIIEEPEEPSGKGNNGWGNGDQNAPGNSENHNGAENNPGNGDHTGDAPGNSGH